MNTKPGDIVLAGGVMMLIFFCGIWAIAGAINTDTSAVNSTVLQSYNNTFNKYAEYNTEVSSLKSQTDLFNQNENKNILEQAFGFISNLVNKAWGAVSLIWTNFGFIGDTFEAISYTFGIPVEITGLISTLLLVVFIFGIIYLLFRIGGWY